MDLTTVSFFPFLWLFESSTATVICSPFDDEDWSFLTSASTGFFIVVETVLSPVWLQEVRMMDGTVCDVEGITLFSSGIFIWKMHLGKIIFPSLLYRSSYETERSYLDYPKFISDKMLFC